MYGLPVIIFSSKGLGTQYSSLQQIGKPLSDLALGQAKIQLYTNIGNGNLVLYEQDCQVSDITGPIHFQYVYNSLSTTPWRLNVTQSLNKINENTLQILWSNAAVQKSNIESCNNQESEELECIIGTKLKKFNRTKYGDTKNGKIKRTDFNINSKKCSKWQPCHCDRECL